MPGVDCKKFSRLNSESRDRDLTANEQTFVDKHLAACEPCQAIFDSSEQAFSLFRHASIEVEPTSTVDYRLMRKVKAVMLRDSLRFWSPAFAGLAVGLFLMLGVLQMLTGGTALPTIRPFGEAKRTEDRLPIIPDLSTNTERR